MLREGLVTLGKMKSELKMTALKTSSFYLLPTVVIAKKEKKKHDLKNIFNLILAIFLY